MGALSACEQLCRAVAHDPCQERDRFPVGAVTFGESVRVTLRIRDEVRALVSAVRALVVERGASEHEGRAHAVDLDVCSEGFSGELQFAPEPHVAFYSFELQLADGQLAYYVPRADGRATAGELTSEAPGDAGFQVTVYDPAFRTPEWLAGAVMYQIFPDRFAQGSPGAREEGLAYHRAMDRPVHLHESWDEPVEWLGAAAPAASVAERMATYDPVDFYGGTLDGIRERLPYLASLGVEVLYLNPVFEARSNHRYDTADYERIDPLLGTEEDFSRLCDEAAEQGISIVLDAVLSHTGNDSRYFNAKGSYDSPGAAQGTESPFYSWYDFSHDGERTTYKSWWGFETLPEVDEHDPSWQRYILGVPGEAGVLEKWLAAGARGYRLDVADELPDDVLERIRTCAKGARPDAAIIGEVWEDATTKTSYGRHRTYALGRALDSAMNYPLRDALLGFATGVLDAHQLAAFLKLQQANYPRPLYHCLMNLMSSHDVERLRTVLAVGGQVKHLPREEQLALMRSITPEQDARAARLQRMIVGLLYALPGTPCLYYGDERGLQAGGDPFCRATFPWNDDGGVAQRGDVGAGGAKARRWDCGEDLTAFYCNLGTMRKGSDVLRRGELACLAHGSDAICAVRTLPDEPGAEIVVAVSNRSEHGQVLALDLLSPELGLSAQVRTAVKARRGRHPFLALEDGIATLSVAPCTTRIFHWA